MSSLNEALEFREAICQEEIRYLKEKISALEGKEKRFGLVETRVNELEEENTNLRHSLGKEREKVKKLSEEEEKTRLKELRFLSAESDAKSDIYRLETTNQSLENKLSHQQTLVCSLTSQNELQANNLAEFTRTKVA
ncbi:hypothetical protein BY458DRAFT_555908 [Sporodiniella umbellata]|nr:hypothetical protein BY458DRAFT_555908 [Sporodiniella umbellata]